MPGLLLLIRHTVIAHIIAWNFDLGPVLHVRLLLYVMQVKITTERYFSLQSRVSTHSHSIFSSSEESELTPPSPTPQSSGCQSDDNSVAAVADTLVPSQSASSAEKELQSQVGKSPHVL